VDAARSALRVGADEVTIAYRRTRAEMPAYAEEVEEAEEEGVKIEFLVSPVRVVEEDGKIRAVEFLRMKLGAPDASGRRRPVPEEGSEFSIDADALIVAIGQQPDLSFLDEGLGADLRVTKWNTVKADPKTCATGRPGVFAGGDVVSGPATVIEAIETGHRATKSILHLLRGEEPASLDFDPPDELEFRPAELREPGERRGRIERRPAKERVKGFAEVACVMAEEEARAEGRRCLRCGVCAECVECIPECTKRLAVVRRPDLFAEEATIVRVETADGLNPFEGRTARLRSADGSESEVAVEVLTARVNVRLCRACGMCRRACPYGAVAVRDGAAQVDGALCKGCGLCAGACPTGAISPRGFSDSEFIRRIARKTDR
jgi:heterodisulfide reductase subunit A-like polyferredoxin